VAAAVNPVSLQDVTRALERGDHEAVLQATDEILAVRPGDDAAHEHRARALLALGRLEEAERHAGDAVRLDPDEIRYRELLANVLSRRGAHRDAAAEYGRLARNDPRQPDWTVAEARERIGAAQASMGVDAARRAIRLDPSNGRAQLALAQALARTGDARGALRAAARAVELLPGDPEAREALADALWLADRDGPAFDEFRAVAAEVSGANRERVLGKARALYRQRAGSVGKAIAAIGPLFDLAFGRGWLRVSE
ncbi:MAG: tetratricopeptide repeat protein, partial [Chloroflexota bacterium]